MTQRKSPASPQRRAPRNNVTNASDSSLHRRQDGYAAPTAEDIYEASVLAAARELGYGLYVRCLDCGRPLTNHRSVRAHIGPVCLSRRVAGV